MDLEEFREEAIPLMAEDIRRGRMELGITSARAAKRVGLSVSRYWALEKGRIPRTQHAVISMVSAAQRLGLKSVRLTYVPDIDKHIYVVLSHDEPLTCFINSLDGRVSELMKQQYFVNPASVIGLVGQLGLQKILDSRQRLDKQLIELWIASLFTISQSRKRDYYVRPIKDDPPDAEVLVINREDRRLSQIPVEITQFGPYSNSVFDVLGRKLQKKYGDEMVLIVFVERSATLYVSDLYEFIQSNNVHNQRIVIIGGAGGAGKIKIMPWELVTKPTRDENALAEEILVDMKEASKGYRDYTGVIYSPPYSSRFPQAFPVFVREITLRR